MDVVRRHGWVVLLLLIVIVGAVLYYRTTTQVVSPTLTIHTAPFDQQVKVTGTVIAGHSVDLGFAQGGRIAHVYAQVGDVVHAGQILADVDNGDAQASVLAQEASLDTQKAKFASLQSGTRPEQLAVLQSSVASAQTALAQADQSVKNVIHDAFTVSDASVRTAVDPLFTNPHAPNAQLAFPTSNSQMATDLASERVAMEALLTAWDTEINEATSTATLAESSSALLHLSVVTALLSDAHDALSAAVPITTVPQSSITTWLASVSAARSTVDGATTALTNAITAEKAAQSAVVTAQKSLTLAQSGATIDDIMAQEAQVSTAAALVDAAQSQLQKTQMVAPFSGVITRMDAKVGSVITPNVPQITMQSQGAFQIETYIPEIDIAHVAVGEHASTTLDAYGSDVVFPAAVISVDPAETIRGGVSTYKTKLQFTQSDPRIRSGMTANVTITTNSIPSAIVVPVSAIFMKGDTSYVQVMIGKAVDTRPVTLGMRTLGQVQVISGLSDGDTVLLVPSP